MGAERGIPPRAGSVKSAKKMSPARVVAAWAGDFSIKSLAEFAARRRQKIKIIFHRDMRVGKNTSQTASVEFCRKRQNYARSRLQSFWQKIPQEFSPEVVCAGDFSIDNPASGRVQW